MTSNYLQKMKKELETLIHVVGIYSQDIGMEFGIEKCALLVMKSGNDGMELSNQDKIRTLGETCKIRNLQIRTLGETYKYLGILEADTNK